MFEDIVRNRSYYERRISDTAIMLERAKINNEQIDAIREEYEKCAELPEELRQYKNNLMLVKTAAITEINEFQNRRIDYLNNLITNALADIFPEEGYTACIQCDFSRKDVCKLVLRDRDGHVSSPYVGQGKLMQYLISFAAVAGITNGIGCQNLFIDEAFGVSDIDRLSEIGDVVQKQVESGMQILLVSQNPALYSGLPHHVIHLHKDVGDKKVVVDGEEDV